MKSLDQIKKDLMHGDQEVVATIAGCSVKTVRNWLFADAPDNFNLHKIFSEYIACRNELIRKYRKKR